MEAPKRGKSLLREYSEESRPCFLGGREFCFGGGVGGLCTIWKVIGLGSCCSPTIERGTMNRRLVRRVFVFVLAGLVGSLGFGWGASVKPGAFDVRETTIAETQAAIRAGKVTCRELVEAYRKRVLAYDQSTHLNSMI